MSRYLKNPKLVAGKITGSSIGSGTSAPIIVTSPINLGTIDNVKITGSVADSFIYTDAQGNLQFGTFESVKYLPGFSASNILLGDGGGTISNTAGAVVLSSTTSVTSAIIQLNTTLAAVGNNARRYNFTESLTWLVQHNMNTTQFFERLTSTTGERFNATVNILDQNAFEVKLTEATAGFVDVIFTTNDQSNNVDPPPKDLPGETVPVASFTQDFAQGPVPFTVSFADLSTGLPISWYWDFGDGNSSYEQNPTHEYTAPGDYTVRLLAANNLGTSEFYSGYVYAQPALAEPPIASFTPTTGVGDAPFEVTFTDTSTGNPTSWNWDFGNAAPASQEQNPTVLFQIPDSVPYVTSLTVSNINGSSTAYGEYTVNGTAPTPSFTTSATAGSPPFTVAFTDTSTGNPTSLAWDFGDGLTSTEQNPIHVYETVGTYTASLTASNRVGVSDIPATAEITVAAMWRITLRDDSGAVLPIYVDAPQVSPGVIYNIPVSRAAVEELVLQLGGLSWTLNGNATPAIFDSQPDPDAVDNFILSYRSYCYMENFTTGRMLYIQGQLISPAE